MASDNFEKFIYLLKCIIEIRINSDPIEKTSTVNMFSLEFFKQFLIIWCSEKHNTSPFISIARCPDINTNSFKALYCKTCKLMYPMFNKFTTDVFKRPDTRKCSNNAYKIGDTSLKSSGIFIKITMFQIPIITVCSCEPTNTWRSTAQILIGDL